MKISIIIPTLNEESTILRTLSDLMRRRGNYEILVVDGGSSDRTVAIASEFTTVISTSRGRAHQMNVGAARATGEAFLFLHADTLLPKNGLTLVREAMARGSEAGRFRLEFDNDRWLLKIFAAYTRFHIFSYGDQGFFISKGLFRQMDGFRADVSFEDVDFYRRLRKVTKPQIIGQPVVTSARRFMKTGSLKQKFINLWLVGLYYLGFNIFSLKDRFYSDVR